MIRIMAGGEERIAKIYEKVLGSYRNPRSFPNDGAYDVYIEQLFIELGEPGTIPAHEQTMRYDVFMNVLRSWLEAKKEFSKKEFMKEYRDRYNAKKYRKYSFYFGVHVKMATGASFPIKKSITINDAAFKVTSYQTIKNKCPFYLDSLKSELVSERGLKESTASSILRREYIYFKASASSVDETVAANLIIDSFELFGACVSLAQERHTKVEYWGTGKIKNRRPIQSAHMLYWIEATNPDMAILQDLGSSISIPNEAINFTKSENRIKAYKTYLYILGKQKLIPIELRIKEFALEFMKALDVTDPHLRMLSLWRCIEIATRLETGVTRRQQDIINILSRYYTNDFWKEQGKLILRLRNGYVHEGRTINHQTRDKYLGWCQDYASTALSLLMWMRINKIGYKSSAEIDTFFELYTKSPETFAIARKMDYARKRSR